MTFNYMHKEDEELEKCQSFDCIPVGNFLHVRCVLHSAVLTWLSVKGVISVKLCKVKLQSLQIQVSMTRT